MRTPVYRLMIFVADLISDNHGSDGLTAQILMNSLPSRGKQEASVLTDDDRMSTRSVTQFGGARYDLKW